MRTLFTTMGLRASGKTTLMNNMAKKDPISYRIDIDTLSNQFKNISIQKLFQFEYDLLDGGMSKSQHNFYVADTNLNNVKLRDLEILAHSRNYKFKVFNTWDAFNGPWDKYINFCIRNSIKRKKSEKSLILKQEKLFKDVLVNTKYKNNYTSYP